MEGLHREDILVIEDLRTSFLSKPWESWIDINLAMLLLQQLLAYSASNGSRKAERFAPPALRIPKVSCRADRAVIMAVDPRSVPHEMVYISLMASTRS